jgi:hypothetical protein
MRKHIALAALLLALGVAFGFAGAYAVEVAGAPNCPTEDSCQPMYDGNRWHIVEVTP